MDAHAGAPSAGTLRAVLVPLALAQFICSFAGSNMNVMINDISEDLDTTVQGVQLAITLFLLVMAAQNAAANAIVPRLEKTRVNPWQADELGAFLDYAGSDRFGPIFELVAMAGLRRGEALGLRWSDAHLDEGYLVVRQQVIQVDAQSYHCAVCGRLHKGIQFGPPKTASGDARRVDLGQAGVGVLLEQRLRQEAERAQGGSVYADHDLVFAREDGNPIHPERVTKRFIQLVKSSGLRQVRLHDLRHGRASLLLASGTDIAVVSKMLGHSSITLTVDTYAHLLAGVGQKAADAADALIPRHSA
jgi:integrase